MTTGVSRSVVQAFFRAFAARDTAKLAPLLHDDVSWVVFGPVELLRFCGERRGKAAVVDLIDRVAPTTYRVTQLESDMLLIDEDRCALLGWITGVTPGDGRTISYRYTMFVRFREQKVIEYHSIIDSFDAAEQVLGRHIRIDPPRSKPRGDMIGDYVAV